MRAEQREPPRVAHDAVELVAMEHEQLPSVGGDVEGALADGDAAESWPI